ncbi:hypothetical protein HOE22_12015 [Candidatus Woesearchaeota archaeon]|jgi:CMP-N,N'-diacetyllegionaminic acid synthase|nr:hypothetical protein [Candidatus Woesearchaeota archaeon]
MNCKSIAIIPCKMDSKRLRNKNLSVIGGKTLLEWSILYAQQSKYVSKIVVSTESDEVKLITKNYPGVHIHARPLYLLGDADTVDVYVDVMKSFNEKGITHVVGLQPDNPDRTKSLDEILEYFITKKYDDLVTVGTDGTRNGSVRVVKFEFVLQDNVSRRVGTILDDCTNIHTKEDLKIADSRIN